YTYNGSAQPSQTLTSSAGGSIMLTGLAGGSYTNIVVTLNGCSSNAGSATLTNPSSPSGNAASSNSPICSGQTLNLSGSSSTSGVSYQWTGPNGFTSTQQNPSIGSATTAASGTYNLTVSVNGCAAPSVSVSVVVRQTPAAPAVSSPVTYCQGDVPSALTATASSGNTLLWYTAATGGTGSTTAPTPSTSSAGTTSYYVSQTTDNNPVVCEGSRSEIQVVVKPKPSIVVTGTDPTSCAPANGKIEITGLTASTSYVLTYTYNGSAQPSQTLTSSAGGSIMLTGLAGGSYTNIVVTLNGCSSDPKSVTLTNPNPPTGVTASSNSPLCTGETLNLTGSSSTSGVTYQWTGPGGYSNTTQSPSISGVTTANAGTYTFTVSLNGCSATPVTVDVVVR
ncbi:MAG: hypothetical protein ACK5G0_01180, partial [Bacteroidota bacterium]